MVSRDASDDEVDGLRAARLEREADERFAELEHLRVMLGNPENRAFFWRLLAECGCGQSSFDPNPLVMAWAEGKRHIGLWLTREIEAVNPAFHTLMYNEAQHRVNQKQERDREPE